ncbi:7-carboxy-7-deazaguanine synthase QueE [Acidobacteriota bacterium]
MQGPSTLKINEIFWSFQGEGLNVGTPSVFLRLSGCSLRCPYCDTISSWEESRFMPVDLIISEIDSHKSKYPNSRVVLTGGEPLEQDISVLVETLKKKNYYVAIETNGCHYRDIAVDWWTVSPKDVTGYRVHEKLFDKIAEVKLIVNQNLNIDVIKGIRKIGESFPIFLQPDWNDKDKYEHTFRLYEQCVSHGIPNIRPGIQLHKIYDVS